MSASEMRAVIGIGSNSIRMITARVCDGGIYGVKRFREELRTFAGLTERGLSDDMIVRVMMAVMRLSGVAVREGAEVSALFATSAARDAANVDVLVKYINEGMGLNMRVLSGEEEARLGFAGATAEREGYCGMIDIGGGSTELAVGVNGEPEGQVSLQLGAARLERVLTSTAEPDDVQAGIMATVSAARGELAAELPGRWVGVGGTFHSLARISVGGERDIEGLTLTLDNVAGMAHTLYGMTMTQKAAVPGLTPSRADIIVPGAWIAASCMRALGIGEIIVTERGNLDGYLRTYR